MTVHVRQNIYGAWLDGEATAMEALRSLCNDYEELDATYKSFEGMREQTREQISNVMVKLGDRVEVKGFGILTMTAPTITEGFDKKALTELVNALVAEGQFEIAQRIAACKTRTSRAGGLRIEREKK